MSRPSHSGSDGEEKSPHRQGLKCTFEQAGSIMSLYMCGRLVELAPCVQILFCYLFFFFYIFYCGTISTFSSFKKCRQLIFIIQRAFGWNNVIYIATVSFTTSEREDKLRNFALKIIKPTWPTTKVNAEVTGLRLAHHLAIKVPKGAEEGSLSLFQSSRK